VDVLVVLCRFSKELLNTCWLKGAAPLHLASLFSHVSCIKALLEQGANAAPVDEHGCSPLVYAVLAGKFVAVKYLAEKASICWIVILDVKTRCVKCAG
jgi:ankyrin repeat protein